MSTFNKKDNNTPKIYQEDKKEDFLLPSPSQEGPKSLYQINPPLAWTHPPEDTSGNSSKHTKTTELSS